jgi:hypothetical protein
MEDNQATEGVRELMRTILVGHADAPFNTESDDLVDFLDQAAYLTMEDLNDLGDAFDGLNAGRRNRARLRYLAALLPGRSLHQLADSIHYVINNGNLMVTDVRDVLRGSRRDIPIAKIQEIGTLLAAGNSLRLVSRTVGVSFDTVERIESFIGIAEARRLKLVDFACDAVREGWSVRRFAVAAGIPKSTAHGVIGRARTVLRELEETV